MEKTGSGTGAAGDNPAGQAKVSRGRGMARAEPGLSITSKTSS